MSAGRSPGLLAARLGCLAVAVVLIGEAGHQFFQSLHATLLHHVFHLAFGGGAVVLFFGYVAWDVRRNGWPSFSWRLSAETKTHAGPDRPS